MHRTCVALLGALAVAAAGCGGGNDDAASDEAQALTQAQFGARADAICRETKQAQRPSSERIAALPPRTELKRLAPILEGVLEETRKGRERLGALRAQAPAADRAAFDAYLAAADRLLAASTRLAEAAKAGDRAAARRVADTEDELSSEQKRRADASGLEDCGDVF